MIEQPDSPLVDDLVASPNIEPRQNGLGPTVLVMHYTGLPTAQKSIEILSRPDCKVSCHYVVDVDGRITQMVGEEMRAWHAGVSSWHGETDINSQSIGIEIQNLGHNQGYPDFPQAQMNRVRDLSIDILNRHNIPSHNVVAHSDIAPGRKTDPGEKFDWAFLHAAGVGHWVAPVAPDVSETGFQLGDQDPIVADVQEKLRRYGYGIIVTGDHTDASVTVVSAFQRHFRPARFDGVIDRSTIATLDALLNGLDIRSTDPIV